MSSHLTEAKIELVHGSYRRCMLSDYFLSLFYENFLGKSEEIASMFRNTNMSRQHLVLAKSIADLVSFAEGKPSACKEMKDLAKQHDQDHLNITSPMYQQWIIAFLETVREIDQHWSPEIQSAWIEVLTIGINYMLEHHRVPTKFDPPRMSPGL
ncbi:MAG: hypothetical protein KDA65_16825 [Planctomycetaceae bacterium]|nr:hypothetical protein [Planctomycetaceae bacterium]